MKEKIRLQRFLAQAGLASRRHAEEMILEGRVQVNGAVVRTLGTSVDPSEDRVSVDEVEHKIKPEPKVYVLLSKPRGYITSAEDPQQRPTVFSILFPGPSEKNWHAGPELPEVRLFPVGRLDYNTEGALLLTNDGDVAHRLMHPAFETEKVYHVKCKGHLTQEQIRKLRQGVELPRYLASSPEGAPVFQKKQKGKGKEKSAPADVKILTQTGSNTWLEICLHEGKNRQIHRMAQAIGTSVLKLARIRYAFLSVWDMPIGTYRFLTHQEVIKLRQMVGIV